MYDAQIFDAQILEMLEPLKSAVYRVDEVQKKLDDSKIDVERLEYIIKRLLDSIEELTASKVLSWKDYGLDSKELQEYYVTKYVDPYRDQVKGLKDEIESLKKERLSIEILKIKLSHWEVLLP
jgi:archaellum component FlaC